MQNRRRTRNYFPEPHFQIRFLRFLLMAAAVQVLAMIGVLYYFLQENYTILVKFAGLDQDVSNLLYHELRVLIGLIAVTFAIYLMGVTVLGVVYSHRIAGPIYAMKRTIRDILDGKDAELKLRRYDEFQDLSDDFNRMVKGLRGSKPFKATGSHT